MKKFDTERAIAPFSKGISEIIRIFEQENRDWRFTKLREWKRQDLYWHNIQYVFWAENSSEFRDLDEEGDDTLTRVINVYRAHGESIIAALGATIPTVRFFP